jgi:hypothetical protein
MQLEFHQLDRRWEHLRVRHPARQRRLLSSLAESGQQTPIVVVAAEGRADRYVVIDGYKRIAALAQLGRDTVDALVWPMDDNACSLHSPKNTPPAWMITQSIAFPFPVPFSTRVTSAERYWVILAKHRSAYCAR